MDTPGTDMLQTKDCVNGPGPRISVILGLLATFHMVFLPKRGEAGTRQETWGFIKNRGTFLGVPKRRIIVY